MCAKIKEKIDASIEGKLRALYELQIIDSKIDRIRTVRGELPLEVQDLEDELEGLDTRINKIQDEIKELETELALASSEWKTYVKISNDLSNKLAVAVEVLDKIKEFT